MALHRRNPALATPGLGKDDLAGSSIFSVDTSAFTVCQTLAERHRAWGLPSDALYEWLVLEGFECEALTRPWPVGGAMVHFAGKSFDIDSAGEDVLTFRAEDRGVVVDLIAWHPETGRFASWLGTTFCLGDTDQIFNPATWFGGGALRVHRTPAEWLHASRDGIVIVRPDLAHAYLGRCPRLSFAHVDHARRVYRWLKPPQPTVELLIEEEVTA